jgi:hypothetical protein
MKRLFKPLGLLVCMGAMVSSCSKKVDAVIPDAAVINPISDYTVTQDPADAFTFNFKNLSKNFSKLEWRFGDDSVSVEENPAHTYLATGDPGANPKWNYQADLKTISTTGNISHKYTYIALSPDNVGQIAVAKTGVTTSNSAELNFSFTLKGTAAKATWTFVDAASFTAAAKTTVIEGLAANSFQVKKSFFTNTFNSVTVKILTTKGSTVTLTRNVTTDGLVENVTGNRISWTPTVDNGSNANENSQKLVDGNVDTKFLVGGSFGAIVWPLRCTFIFLTPQKIKLYAIGNANDSPSRDPKSWTVEGSNDGGATWTLMDSRTMTKNFFDQNTDLGATSDGQKYKKLFYYPVANPTEYSMVRLNIFSNWGDGLLQFSEFQLFR